MNTYTRLTDKDINRMMNTAAVCNQPYHDITITLAEIIPKTSFSTYIALVYNWGYLQGKRGVKDWHGQGVKKN